MSSAQVHPVRSRRQTVWASAIALASLWSAAVTYVVMSMAAWVLPTQETTLVLTFLSLLFATYGVLAGVSLETTRTVAVATRHEAPSGPQMWQVASVVAVVTALVVTALAPVWRDQVLHDSSTTLVVALSVAMLGYAFHAVIVGAATGQIWWGTASQVMGLEATGRLALTALVVVMGAGATSLAAASVAGAFCWLFLLAFSARARSVLRLRADGPAGQLGARMGVAVVAQGASALMVVGFPILLAATTPQAEYRNAAPFLLAIALTRAPVLMPLNALHGVAVSKLVHAGDRIGALTIRLVGILAVVGLVGAAAAAAIGPWLMVTMFGADYDVSALVLACLTAAAATTAAATISGAMAQALGAHGWYAGGWLVAVGVCLLVLQVPGSLELRGCLAAAVAPLAGLLVHAVGVVRVRPRPGDRTGRP